MDEEVIEEEDKETVEHPNTEYDAVRIDFGHVNYVRYICVGCCVEPLSYWSKYTEKKTASHTQCLSPNHSGNSNVSESFVHGVLMIIITIS